MRSEDFHLITELVTEGVPNLLNICEPTFGTFPLFLAVELRKIKVIKELINLGCNVNICNINGIIFFISWLSEEDLFAFN